VSLPNTDDSRQMLLDYDSLGCRLSNDLGLVKFEAFARELCAWEYVPCKSSAPDGCAFPARMKLLSAFVGTSGLTHGLSNGGGLIKFG
jgi:hypothetical protein